MAIDKTSTETFQDFSGNTITFEFYMHELPTMITLHATELNGSDVCRQFTVYDSSNPHFAWLKMKEKIHKELNTRYFSTFKDDFFHSMNFDYFRGSISQTDGEDEICLVVDGKKMSAKHLLDLILAHMGHQIEIHITEE